MIRDEEIRKGEFSRPMVGIVSRPIIVTIILGTGLLFLHEAQFSFLPLYLLIVTSYLTSLLIFLGFRVGLPAVPLITLQHLFDIFLASAIIHFSGGILSPFSLLYFLLIISASMQLHFRGGFTFATLSALTYSALLFSYYKKILPQNPFTPNFSAEEVFLRGDLHVICFFLVAMMSGSLAQGFKKRGEELEEMRLTTEDILENMGAGVITVDGRGRVVYFNRAASEILSCSAKEIQGHPFQEAFHSSIRPLTDLIVEGFSEEDIRKGEFGIPDSTLRNQNREIEVEVRGKKKPLGVTTTLLLNRKGKKTGFLLLFTDLTEMKETERRLRHSERMAAIGELSAGIAHEIRNPLASIQGSAEILHAELNGEGESQKLMHLILRETDRLNSIIEDFLQFARARPLHLELTPFHDLMNEVLEMVKNHPEYSHGIEIQNRISNDGLSTSMDKDQMKQVFLNICLNGVKAMEGKGKLSIYTCQKGERVGVVFEDTGKGILPRDRDKIFQPFYTTSEKGHGLGLAIAHRIVEGHGGEIQVDSETGRGSRFIVWIPMRIG